MRHNWLHDLFEAAVPSGPGITRRRMFGFHCAFLRGNMFCGHGAQTFMLRLSEADRSRLLAIPGSSLFEPKDGFVMHEYVVPAPELLEDLDGLRDWVNRSLSYAASLPLKQGRARKAATAKRIRA